MIILFLSFASTKTYIKHGDYVIKTPVCLLLFSTLRKTDVLSSVTNGKSTQSTTVKSDDILPKKLWRKNIKNPKKIICNWLLYQNSQMPFI